MNVIIVAVILGFNLVYLPASVIGGVMPHSISYLAAMR